MLMKFYLPNNTVYSRDVGTNPPVVGDYMLLMNSANTTVVLQGRIVARRVRFTDGAPAPVEWEALVDNAVAQMPGINW